MIHRLQYERLKEYKKTFTPLSRFILVKRTNLWFFNKIEPVIIQERISGTPLLEMVEENVDAIIPYLGPIYTKDQHKTAIFFRQT